jgi:hypothetical protein
VESNGGKKVKAKKLERTRKGASRKEINDKITKEEK